MDCARRGRQGGERVAVKGDEGKRALLIYKHLLPRCVDVTECVLCLGLCERCGNRLLDLLPLCAFLGAVYWLVG
jgi:hypothetical protein